MNAAHGFQATRRGVQAASDYHLSDYASEDGECLSRWLGALCPEFGLVAGAGVGQKEFIRVLKGQHPTKDNPDGSPVQLTREQRGRVPSYELVFPAEKSVSLVALEDPRVFTAHCNAVRIAIGQMEQHAYITDQRGGRSSRRKIKGLLIAEFPHLTSRAGETQLHSHTHIANIGIHGGRHYALAAKALFDAQTAIARRYHVELGAQIIALGYELEGTVGNWRIKGSTQALEELASTRSRQMASVQLVGAGRIRELVAEDYSARKDSGLCSSVTRGKWPR